MASKTSACILLENTKLVKICERTTNRADQSGLSSVTVGSFGCLSGYRYGRGERGGMGIEGGGQGL